MDHHENKSQIVEFDDINEEKNTPQYFNKQFQDDLKQSLNEVKVIPITPNYMISQFPGTLKTNGGVMVLLLAQVFPIIENDDQPHSPGVLQFI